MKTVKKFTEEEFLTYNQIVKKHEKEPAPSFVWAGITQQSIGTFFGPPKSGKTTFCECLAIHLAVGRKKFFDQKLEGKPRKVLFLGLEESWIMRVKRNRNQALDLTEDEKKLLGTNYCYQGIDFLRIISKPQDWNRLRKLIVASGADIVFIDSVTRLNHGSLDKGSDAEKIMLNLRDICLDLKITLVCIHHTPKIGNSPLSMDSMRGSVVFAQESDFIIGVRKAVGGTRYLKNIEFRYMECDDSKVFKFEFTQNSNIKFLGTGNEYEILEGMDGRIAADSRSKIVDIVSSACKRKSTKELVTAIKKELGIEERQIKSFLSDLVKHGKIKRPERGYYCSINCPEKGGNDEEE